ncbi:MAG: hypothetical protein J2P32_16055, partial [Actinobacteria bacterium]|nr:hypothetical protein [Actinomycetota bacterium]
MGARQLPEGTSMKLASPRLRRAALGTTAALALLTGAAGIHAPATAAVRSAAAAGPSDPYSPAYHHPYRRGVVPTRSVTAKMRAWAAQHHGTALAGAAPRAAASGPQLTYGGGNPTTKVGVTTGPPRVYLVFYGSQWGAIAPSTDGSGDLTFANDPAGEAPYLQEFFKGVGTGGERWSGVMTQYCNDPNSSNACPAGSAFVGYPAGGALAGVWADEINPSPYRASGFDLASEA